MFILSCLLFALFTIPTAIRAASIASRAEVYPEIYTGGFGDIPSGAYTKEWKYSNFADYDVYLGAGQGSLTAEFTTWGKANRCLGDGSLTMTVGGTGKEEATWQAFFLSKTKVVLGKPFDLPGGATPWLPGRANSELPPIPEGADTLWVRAYSPNGPQQMSPYHAILIQGGRFEGC